MPVILSTSNIIIDYQSNNFELKADGSDYFIQITSNYNNLFTSNFNINNNKVYQFLHSQGQQNTTNHIININQNVKCDILIIGGGGGGGMNSYFSGGYGAGGGGAGALIYLQDVVMEEGIYSIEIGKGGDGHNSKGIDTKIIKDNKTIFKALGGGCGASGYGGSYSVDGANRSGGSGGGSSYAGGYAAALTDNIPVGAYGNSGVPGYRNGGGGGGAESAGQDGYYGGIGGSGKSINITGNNIFYAGGGSGGYDSRRSNGGGGVGNDLINSAAFPHTGSGGGAYNYDGVTHGGKGGSGIVIIRIKNTMPYIFNPLNPYKNLWKYNYSNSNIFYYGSAGINNSSPDYNLHINGNMYVSATAYTGSSQTSWVTPSDKRIKENIVKASYDKCLQNVKNIELYKFNFKNNAIVKSNDFNQLGFIAQEVQSLYPKAVEVNMIKDTTGEILDLLTLNTTQINYTLYGAVKKLIKKIEIIEEKLGIENDIIEEDTITFTTNNNININNNIVIDTSNIYYHNHIINFIKNNSNCNDNNIKEYIKELNIPSIYGYTENTLDLSIQYLKNLKDISVQNPYYNE